MNYTDPWADMGILRSLISQLTGCCKAYFPPDVKRAIASKIKKESFGNNSGMDEVTIFLEINGHKKRPGHACLHFQISKDIHLGCKKKSFNHDV